MSRRWIVVGAGFRGIVAAHLLAGQGQRVTLVDRTPFLGGVLHSESWDELVLDKGCHLFDTSSTEAARFVHDVLGDNVRPIAVRYASRIAGRLSEGVAVPDFSGCDAPLRARIEREVVQAAEAEVPAATLGELIDARYGRTAGGPLRDAAAKIFRADPDALEPDALRATAMTRIRIGSDETSTDLKARSSALDARIAVPAGGDPLRFYADPDRPYAYRNFYPARGGMRAFCAAARGYLEAAGVRLALGAAPTALDGGPAGFELVLSDDTRLSADSLCWTLDLEALARLALSSDAMADTVHAVPMVIVYFAVDPARVAGYTYVHDYEPSTRLYRAAALGEYGGQRTPGGETLVGFELPVELGSAVWDAPEAHVRDVWREAADLGFVSGDPPLRHHVLKTPVSYKAPRLGYAAAAAEVERSLAALPLDLRVSNPLAFSKKDIFGELRTLLAPR